MQKAKLGFQPHPRLLPKPLPAILRIAFLPLEKGKDVCAADRMGLDWMVG